MGRLFWKLFVSLSVTLILIGVGIGGGVYLYDQSRQNDEGIQRDRRAEFVVGLVANAIRHGGVNSARVLLGEWPGHSHAPNVLIIDHAGRDALGRTVPPAGLRKALSMLESQRDKRSVRRVTAPDGHPYLLFLPADSADIAPPRMLPPGLQILIAILASLLFSATFATYLTRPIRHLRKVSTRLAEGDLNARVTPAIGNRNDELSDLGMDFDFMATRLQNLLNAQRQLLHDVSHELRSPVARMRLAAGLAQQQPAKLQPALERIERETERLDELLGQILTLARLESDTASDTTERVCLEELLDEIVNDAGFEAQAQNRSLHYHVDHPASVQGQRELLRRALENIIRNAIRYTRENTAVEIRLTEEDQAPVILIRDHGPGIPDAELNSVFQPFYRVRAQDQSDRAGYGLGLAIARRALELHQARIKLMNAAGGGLLVKVAFNRA